MSRRKNPGVRLQVIADLVQRRIARMTPQEHRIAALRRQTPQKYALDRLGGAVELHAVLKEKRRKDTRHKERADEAWRDRARRHLELLVNTKNVPRPDAGGRVDGLAGRLKLVDNAAFSDRTELVG